VDGQRLETLIADDPNNTGQFNGSFAPKVLKYPSPFSKFMLKLIPRERNDVKWKAIFSIII